MSRQHTSSETERLVQRGQANPYAILHGGALTDPRVQHGRTSQVRREAADPTNAGHNPGESDDKKKRLDADAFVMGTLARMAVQTAAASSESWKNTDWSKPIPASPQIVVADKVTGQKLYRDDGLTCSRIPENTASAAKVTDPAPKKADPVSAPFQQAAPARKPMASYLEADRPLPQAAPYDLTNVIAAPPSPEFPSLSA